MTICVAVAATGCCQGHFDPWEGATYFHEQGQPGA